MSTNVLPSQSRPTPAHRIKEVVFDFKLGPKVWDAGNADALAWATHAELLSPIEDVLNDCSVNLKIDDLFIDLGAHATLDWPTLRFELKEKLRLALETHSKEGHGEVTTTGTVQTLLGQGVVGTIQSQETADAAAPEIWDEHALGLKLEEAVIAGCSARTLASLADSLNAALLNAASAARPGRMTTIGAAGIADVLALQDPDQDATDLALGAESALDRDSGVLTKFADAPDASTDTGQPNVSTTRRIAGQADVTISAGSDRDEADSVPSAAEIAEHDDSSPGKPAHALRALNADQPSMTQTTGTVVHDEATGSSGSGRNATDPVLRAADVLDRDYGLLARSADAQNASNADQPGASATTGSAGQADPIGSFPEESKSSRLELYESGRKERRDVKSSSGSVDQSHGEEKGLVASRAATVANKMPRLAGVSSAGNSNAELRRFRHPEGTDAAQQPDADLEDEAAQVRAGAALLLYWRRDPLAFSAAVADKDTKALFRLWQTIQAFTSLNDTSDETERLDHAQTVPKDQLVQFLSTSILLGRGSRDVWQINSSKEQATQGTDSLITPEPDQTAYLLDVVLAGWQAEPDAFARFVACAPERLQRAVVSAMRSEKTASPDASVSLQSLVTDRGRASDLALPDLWGDALLASWRANPTTFESYIDSHDGPALLDLLGRALNVDREAPSLPLFDAVQTHMAGQVDGEALLRGVLRSIFADAPIDLDQIGADIRDLGKGNANVAETAAKRLTIDADRLDESVKSEDTFGDGIDATTSFETSDYLTARSNTLNEMPAAPVPFLHVPQDRSGKADDKTPNMQTTGSEPSRGKVYPRSEEDTGQGARFDAAQDFPPGSEGLALASLLDAEAPDSETAAAIILAAGLLRPGVLAELLAAPDLGLGRTERLLRMLEPDALDRLLTAFKPGLSPRDQVVIKMIWDALPEKVMAPSLAKATKWQFMLCIADGGVQNWGGVKGLVARTLFWLAQDMTRQSQLAQTLAEVFDMAPPAGPEAARIQISQSLQSLVPSVPAHVAPSVKTDHETQDEAAEASALTQAAGLVLMTPWLPLLFDRLGLLDGLNRHDPDVADRVMDALWAVMHGDAPVPESPRPRVLERLICAIPIEVRLRPPQAPDPDLLALTNSLLDAVLQQWTALGKSSVTGLRETFLRREGLLRPGPDGVVLHVAPKAYDMLLDRLPWAFRLVKFGWMAQPLYVNWRNAND